jgi:hypothetical protein
MRPPGRFPASYQAKTPVDAAPFARGDNAVMAELFAQMVQRGILLDPTMRVYVEGDKRAAKPGAKPSQCSADLAAILTGRRGRRASRCPPAPTGPRRAKARGRRSMTSLSSW